MTVSRLTPLTGSVVSPSPTPPRRRRLARMVRVVPLVYKLVRAVQLALVSAPEPAECQPEVALRLDDRAAAEPEVCLYVIGTPPQGDRRQGRRTMAGRRGIVPKNYRRGIRAAACVSSNQPVAVGDNGELHP